MIEESKRAFIECAQRLPKRYELYSIDELANKYCEAVDTHDTYNEDTYISALMLRFWFQIDKMYQSCKTFGVDRDDICDRLYDCIKTACSYRTWQDPEKHTNAQACINQVIKSRGTPGIIGEANFLKNYRPKMSIDDVLNNDGDTVGDLVADESFQIFDETSDIIQSLIRDNKIIEAIIADNIAYKDVFKHYKHNHKIDFEDRTYIYTEHEDEFWPFKLVQELNAIDEKYLKEFTSRYKVDPEILEIAVSTLRKSTNQRKYKYIDKFLAQAKELFAL